MPFEPFSVASRLESQLAKTGTEERAEAEKAHLKSSLAFLGTPVPQIRRLVRTLRADLGDLDHDDLCALAAALWSVPIHERRVAAVELLALCRSALRPDALAVVEGFLRDAGTWALADALAERVAGDLVQRDPDLGGTLDRWSADPDLWLRRASLLALLPGLRRGHDFGRFARYADTMLDDREFLIRKAIGWVLREAGKQRPDLVFDWLAPRMDRVAGITVREAVKYLGEERRETLLAAHRERGPV